MIVLDNFLPFFDDLLIRTQQARYYTDEQYRRMTGTGDHFRGERTRNAIRYATRLSQFIEDSLGVKLSSLYFHRHPVIPEVKGRMHRDGHFNMAGVIYLKGASGCGTLIEDTLVDFRENRLVAYDANRLHAPEGFTTDRLVVTFFSMDMFPEAHLK